MCQDLKCFPSHILLNGAAKFAPCTHPSILLCRDQFSVHSQMASQLYLAMYDTCRGSLTLEKFKETLQIAAKERAMVASTEGGQSIANEDVSDQVHSMRVGTPIWK